MSAFGGCVTAYSRRRVHIMAMPRRSGSDTKRSRAGGAQILHRCDNGGAGERAPLQRSQHTQFVYARPEPIHTASLTPRIISLKLYE